MAVQWAFAILNLNACESNFFLIKPGEIPRISMISQLYSLFSGRRSRLRKSECILRFNSFPP